MKNIKKTLVTTLIASSLWTSCVTNASELSIDKGNGNDGCQIGLDGHEGNQHKVDFMTKFEFEEYLRTSQFTFEQMSNNEGSNGWITYHIYDGSGNQIEVVLVSFMEDIIEDGSEDDNYLRPEFPLIPVDPVYPPVGDRSEDDNIMIEISSEDGCEEDDYLRPEIPMIPVEPIYPEVSDGSEEDNIMVTPPDKEDSNNEAVVVTPLPDVDEEISNDAESSTDTLPHTGGTPALLTLLSGVFLIRESKKLL